MSERAPSAEMGPGPIRRVVRVIGWSLLGLLIFDAVLIAVFRRRWQPGIDAIRRFNKSILNPAMMRFAGRRHWYASVVHHTGRKSGNRYETPVWAIPSGGYFYIPLPYGTDVDWCQNVLAAECCVVESQGLAYTTCAPDVVPASAAVVELPIRARIRFGVYGVDHYLRLERRAQSLAA